MQYVFQNGQIKTGSIPFAAPQISIGNFYGTQAVIRCDVVLVRRYGRHRSILLPVSTSNPLQLGDTLVANAVPLRAQGSKTVSVLTLYGGLQYETLTVDLGAPIPAHCLSQILHRAMSRSVFMVKFNVG